MAAEVFRGKTQEAVKPPGACSRLLRVWEGAGIQSRVSQASLCALRIPRPCGELERLLTTLKGSADRPQSGWGKLRCAFSNPCLAFRKGGRSSGLPPRRCSPKPGGVHRQDASLGMGILAEVTRRHPQHGSAPGAQMWRFAQRALDGSAGSVPGGTQAPTARPPACSQRRASRVADLQTWLPEAGHLGHSRGSLEKAFPGIANPQSSFAGSSG